MTRDNAYTGETADFAVVPIKGPVVGHFLVSFTKFFSHQVFHTSSLAKLRRAEAGDPLVAEQRGEQRDLGLNCGKKRPTRRDRVAHGGTLDGTGFRAQGHRLGLRLKSWA
jgi:hypothetical protein